MFTLQWLSGLVHRSCFTQNKCNTLQHYYIKVAFSAAFDKSNQVIILSNNEWMNECFIQVSLENSEKRFPNGKKGEVGVFQSSCCSKSFLCSSCHLLPVFLHILSIFCKFSHFLLAFPPFVGLFYLSVIHPEVPGPHGLIRPYLQRQEEQNTNMVDVWSDVT